MRTIQPLLSILAIIILGGCAQRFAVSINDQTVYDPRPNATEYRFSDPGLQGCVNFALQGGGSVATLTVLACPGWEITEIEGIGALAALQFLDLSNNQISSLAPLESLNRLSSLTATNNRITDIAPLLSMRTLTSAVLTGNNNIQCGQLDNLDERLGNNLRRPAECRG
ncbi:MAG: leucine-rich repeat protein [Gammaproteobacteria bacterium]|nr:leucine-rich repeat protein [Gammaproteobacteria bacterium]MDP2139295.1 leucine-rich repeat protein [Gammaproteobacteria bacterium]MDP2346780.1 leucine-rich repeat protein [Gammaproteobacteria bacterium]